MSARDVSCGRHGLNHLWDGIVGSHELTPGEAGLIDRRLQDHLDNPDDVVSWDEVKTKLQAKYRE
jgi:hypothetical protein